MDNSDDLYSAAGAPPSVPHPELTHPPANTKTQPENKTTSNNEPKVNGLAGPSHNAEGQASNQSINGGSASDAAKTNGHMAIPYTEEHPEMVDLDTKHQCVYRPHTLSQPLQTPCGHRICTPCLDIVLDGQGSVMCPADEESCVILSKENVFPDFGARRELNHLDVYCIFRTLGCLVMLKLKDLKNHIQDCAFRPLECRYKLFGCRSTLTKANYESHVRKCNYEPVKCSQCGSEIPRYDMQDHMSNECPKGITRCPHKCGATNIPKDELSAHLTNCPSKPRTCAFQPSGCDFTGSTDALLVHNRDHMGVHLKQTQEALGQRDSQIQTISQELASSKETIEKLNTDMHRCSGEMENLKSVTSNQEQKIRDMTKMLAKQGVGLRNLEENGKQLAKKEQLARHEQELNNLKTKVTSQESMVAQLGTRQPGNLPDTVRTKMTTYERQMAIQQVRLAEADLRFHCLENTNYNGVLFWKIDEYTRKKGEAVSGQTLSLYSQHFFTSRYGYKMCARVYLNGDGQGRGSHLSVFFVVMRGEFDALLKWPFTQKVTLTLVDQSGRRHISDTFRPDPTSSSFKKPEMEMNIASGCPLFAAHSVVEKVPYMKDDTIFIKVSVDISDLEP